MKKSKANKTTILVLAAIAIVCGGCASPVSPSAGQATSSNAGETEPPDSPSVFAAHTPGVEGGFECLFADCSTFSATMMMSGGLPDSNKVTVPLKLWFDGEKSRLEFDLLNMYSSGGADAANASLMKALGMDAIVTINRPDLKLTYTIVPAMNIYAQTVRDEEYDIDSIKLGTDTIDGHDCEKFRVSVTKKGGITREYLVWKALDLQKFPFKISASQNGTNCVVLLKNVSFSKPETSVFDVSAGYIKYTDLTAFNNATMAEMKRRLNIYMNDSKAPPKSSAP